MSKFFNSPVVGVDVSADFSVATMLSPDGSVFKKAFKFNHDAEGFEFFLETIKKAEENFDTPIPVFMESTGIYHLNLFYFLINNNVQAFVINPLITHSSKNKGIRKLKSDKTDSFSIAKLGKFESIKTCKVIDPAIYELRAFCREYHELITVRANIKTQISNTLRLYFPGYEKVFSNTTGMASLAILRLYPSPKSIIHTDSTLIKDLLKTAKRGTKWVDEIYDKLIAASQNALTLSFLSSTAKLTRLIELYDFYSKQIDSLALQIQQYINSSSIPFKMKNSITLIDGIPGIGFMSAVTLMSEIGDISDFKKAKHLIAFFGVDPSVNQSGKFNSTNNKISKRGSRLSRKILYDIVLTCVRNKVNGEPYNPVLQQYFNENLKGKAKKVAFLAVTNKLVKYIFSVLKNQKPYELRDPKVHNQYYIESTCRTA